MSGRPGGLQRVPAGHVQMPRNRTVKASESLVRARQALPPDEFWGHTWAKMLGLREPWISEVVAVAVAVGLGRQRIGASNTRGAAASTCPSGFWAGGRREEGAGRSTGLIKTWPPQDEDSDGESALPRTLAQRPGTVRSRPPCSAPHATYKGALTTSPPAPGRAARVAAANRLAVSCLALCSLTSVG